MHDVGRRFVLYAKGIGMSDSSMQIQAKSPMIIAPCGLNCSLCRAYLRDRKPCSGCRGGVAHKSKACLSCAIKNCNELIAGGHPFCYSCDRFPCTALRHHDARYQTTYGLSVIANLERIQAIGVERFITEETLKWSCSECGSLLCMHEQQCPNCGYAGRGS